MNPITNKDILNERYENIDVFMRSDELLQQDIITLLTSITDINKQSRKIANYTFKYTDITSFLKSIKSAKELNEKLNISASKFVNVIPKRDDLTKAEAKLRNRRRKQIRRGRTRRRRNKQKEEDKYKYHNTISSCGTHTNILQQMVTHVNKNNNTNT